MQSVKRYLLCSVWQVFVSADLLQPLRSLAFGQGVWTPNGRGSWPGLLESSVGDLGVFVGHLRGAEICHDEARVARGFQDVPYADLHGPPAARRVAEAQAGGQGDARFPIASEISAPTWGRSSSCTSSSTSRQNVSFAVVPEESLVPTVQAAQNARPGRRRSRGPRKGSKEASGAAPP